METITIPKSEYDSLIRDKVLLRALNAAGVDNWEGYEHAMNRLPVGFWEDEPA